MEKAVLKLNRTGDSMPIMGFGTWKIPKDICAEITHQTLKAGYKLLDCACDYGNQEQVGKGIKKAFDEGIIERKDLFVTSKLWNTFHRKQHVRPACLKTMKDLGLQYLDLYLIHFPISLKYVDPEVRYPPEWINDPKANKPCMIEDYVPIIETWKAMQELVKQGLVKNIGVSNFNVSLLRDLINSCSIKPAVLQVEIHPYNTQKKLIKFCRQNQIQITSYSTMGASSYVQLGAQVSNQILVEDKTIVQLGQKYKKTTAQIILKWAAQNQLAIIPKTSKQARLKENSDIFSWQLQKDDLQRIDKLNRNRRYNDPGEYCLNGFNKFFPIYE